MRPCLCKISARLRKLARNDEGLDEGAGSPAMACVLDGLSHPFRDDIQLRSPGAERSMAQTDQGLDPARVVIVVCRRKAGLEQFLTSINIAHLPDDPRRTLLGLHAQRRRRISGHGQGRFEPSQPFTQAAGVMPEATLE